MRYLSAGRSLIGAPQEETGTTAGGGNAPSAATLRLRPSEDGAPCRRPGLCTALLVLSVFTAAVASATDLLDRAQAAQRRGHPETAYRMFSEAANAGDPIGAFGLGVLYFQGSGVGQDFDQSSRWFQTAAEQGYAPAQFNLGNACLHGQGVPRDMGRAEYWWRKAAHQGLARARFNLGSLFFRQDSAPELQEEGVAWYRAAAERGYADARRKLEELGEPLDYRDITPDPDREPQRDEARIMTLDPEGFTIQFFSARRPESTARFVAMHRLTGRALRYRFRREGETWTGAVYGWYAERTQADATRDHLRTELQVAGPWVRAVADIQALIRAAREGKTE